MCEKKRLQGARSAQWCSPPNVRSLRRTSSIPASSAVRERSRTCPIEGDMPILRLLAYVCAACIIEDALMRLSARDVRRSRFSSDVLSLLGVVPSSGIAESALDCEDALAEAVSDGIDVLDTTSVMDMSEEEPGMEGMSKPSPPDAGSTGELVRLACFEACASRSGIVFERRRLEMELGDPERSPSAGSMRGV